MKLLRSFACRLAEFRGNVYKATVMGDAIMEESADAGSIPASSIPGGLVIQRIASFYYVHLLYTFGTSV